MIVVLMRRELPLEQSLRLWEMLWADDLLQDMPQGGSADDADMQTPSKGTSGIGDEAAGGPSTPDAQARVLDQGAVPLADDVIAAEGVSSRAEIPEPVLSPPMRMSFEWSSRRMKLWDFVSGSGNGTAVSLEGAEVGMPLPSPLPSLPPVQSQTSTAHKTREGSLPPLSPRAITPPTEAPSSESWTSRLMGKIASFRKSVDLSAPPASPSPMDASTALPPSDPLSLETQETNDNVIARSTADEIVAFAGLSNVVDDASITEVPIMEAASGISSVTDDADITEAASEEALAYEGSPRLVLSMQPSFSAMVFLEPPDSVASPEAASSPSDCGSMSRCDPAERSSSFDTSLAFPSPDMASLAVAGDGFCPRLSPDANSDVSFTETYPPTELGPPSAIYSEASLSDLFSTCLLKDSAGGLSPGNIDHPQLPSQSDLGGALQSIAACSVEGKECLQLGELYRFSLTDGVEPGINGVETAARLEDPALAVSISSPEGETAPPPREGMDLFIYFVAAVVVSQRRAVLSASCHDCDDTLKHFQSLTRVDVVDCMTQARRFRKMVSSMAI